MKESVKDFICGVLLAITMIVIYVVSAIFN